MPNTTTDSVQTLRRVQADLDLERTKYFELYDLALVG